MILAFGGWLHIVRYIKTFINAFNKINGNIYNAHIFESEILKLMNDKLLGWNHFRQNLTEAEKNVIRSICLKNLFNPTTLLILPWDIICERHNIIFTVLEKIHLSSLVSNALRIFRNNFTKETSNITSIFSPNKKGSRKFRQILEESQF